MNDNQARRVASLLGLRAVNIPVFLLTLKEAGLKTRAEITELVLALEERDRYGFRKDVRDLLLA